MSGTNLYEAARLSGGSSIIENLQSQLKLREGEIAQLQVEMKNKPKSSFKILLIINSFILNVYVPNFYYALLFSSVVSLRSLVWRGVVL